MTGAACDRGLRRIADQLLRIICEERDALLRPVEESERRINSMRSTIADAQRSVLDLAYLLIAEQHRLSRVFADHRQEFLVTRRQSSQEELERALGRVTARSGPRFRREAMRAAQQIARRQLTPWLAAEETNAEEAFRTAVHRFVDLGNDFLRRLAEAGVPELASMPKPLDAEQGFRTRSRFYFHDMIELAQPASPVRLIADLVLEMVGARRLIAQDAHEFLERRLEINTMRVQGDVDKRVADSKSRLETNIRILLHEVSAVAERALLHARSTQKAGASAVESALSRLSISEAEIRRLCPPSRQNR
jgi:hypothetical protein